MKVWVLLASLLVASYANAGIYSLSIPGNVGSSLTSENGWMMDDTSAIDFYTFELMTATEVDFVITASSSVGLSLYEGALMNDPGFLFSHSGDFIDFMGNSFAYLMGSDPFVPSAGSSSLAAGVLTAGWYTLALGGNAGFDLGGFDYTLAASVAPSAAVSEPASIATALLMLSVLVWRQRYYKR